MDSGELVGVLVGFNDKPRIKIRRQHPNDKYESKPERVSPMESFRRVPLLNSNKFFDGIKSGELKTFGTFTQNVLRYEKKKIKEAMPPRHNGENGGIFIGWAEGGCARRNDDEITTFNDKGKLLK
ncbi:hypothetical protein RUM44_001901 [Polyplax serrata]|uniref:Uncharacterized protein n=1 Tax=Polyplax serrata TaxID=468196 RepID=A0ABR1ALC8_POLSC